MVAGLGKNMLVLRSKRPDAQLSCAIKAPEHSLMRVIDRPFARHVEVGRDIVRARIQRLSR
jgi:hypothetical protein